MVQSWKSKIETVLKLDETVVILVQNKIDLIDDAQVSPQEAEALAKEFKVRLYRVSVKNNIQIHEMFQYAATQHLKRIQKRDEKKLAELQALNNPFIKNTSKISEVAVAKKKADCVIS